MGKPLEFLPAVRGATGIQEKQMLGKLLKWKYTRGQIKNRMVRMRKASSLLVGVVCAGFPMLSLAARGQMAKDGNVLVVQGAKILPITSAPIEHGVLVIKKGKIVAVGEQGKIQIPAGATVKDATGKVVMPGIVDSHSHIGIDGNPTVSDSQDANEGSGRLSRRCAHWMRSTLPIRTFEWRPRAVLRRRASCREAATAAVQSSFAGLARLSI